MMKYENNWKQSLTQTADTDLQLEEIGDESERQDDALGGSKCARMFSSMRSSRRQEGQKKETKERAKDETK